MTSQIDGSLLFDVLEPAEEFGSLRFNSRRPTLLAVSRLVVVAALCWSATSEARGKEFVAVREAEAGWPSCLQASRQEVALACHRLKEGSDLVLAMRYRVGGAWGDRGTFQKLTVVLPADVTEGDTFEVGSGGVAAFFSDGPSAFPGKLDCYGAARSGKLAIKKVDARRVSARLTAIFDQVSSVASRKCEERSVDLDISGTIRSLTSLSAWDGMPGPDESLWREANP